MTVDEILADYTAEEYCKLFPVQPYTNGMFDRV